MGLIDSRNAPRSEPVLMKGNLAICAGAIWAGCRFFFGYPITPQNEIPEHMSKRLPEVGGVFLQAESELAAINMVYGASSVGARVMTSSSSPGVSLKQEGISYMVGAELPGVIVNICRGGPGLGNIGPAQSDYFQSTRGGGHGDYRLVVYGPASVQEMYDLTAEAFWTAEQTRAPVIVLGDAIIGQMMEPVRFRTDEPPPPSDKPWATTGAKGRPPNVVNSLWVDYDEMEEVNLRVAQRFDEVSPRILDVESVAVDDAEILLVAYGSVARVCLTAVRALRDAGVRAGLVRPITLSPFPADLLRGLSGQVRHMLTVEMSLGQMVEDVRLAVEGRCPVHFFGRTGGNCPSVKEIVEKCKQILVGEENPSPPQPFSPPAFAKASAGFDCGEGG